MAAALRWRSCRVARSAFATAGTLRGQYSDLHRTNGTHFSAAPETESSAIARRCHRPAPAVIMCGRVYPAIRERLTGAPPTRRLDRPVPGDPHRGEDLADNYVGPPLRTTRPWHQRVTADPTQTRDKKPAYHRGCARRALASHLPRAVLADL